MPCFLESVNNSCPKFDTFTPERKEFINGLLEHYQPSDAHDVQEMLKDLLGDALQGMLEAEMDDKLGYSKYDDKNKTTDDSRNVQISRN